MKKDLYEILDTLTPEELDTLPEDVFQAEKLDDATLKSIQTAVAEKTGVTLGTKKYTENKNASTETGITAPVRKTARRTSVTFRRLLAAAACAALLVGVGAGAYAYAAARKEYKNALTFFYENDLSTEGLTRNEIKEVYRDFYSLSFTNDLTTDVLLNSRPDVIRGYEITGDDAEWDTTLPETSISDYKTPVYYEYEKLYTPIEGTYNPLTQAYQESFDKSIFTKYHNGEKVWEVSFTDININGFYGDPVSETEPVLVYGIQQNSDYKDKIAMLILLDADGNVLWKTLQNNSTGFDTIYKALCNPDGSYTTFGRCSVGDEVGDHICVNKYSKDGKPVFANVLDIKDRTIEHVALTDSGYLISLSSYIVVDFSHVLKLDFDGNLVGDFRYESEGCDFYIADFCEHNGTVYISGYATPKAPNDYRNYLMRDLYSLRIKLSSFEHRDKYIHNSFTKEELLAMFREHFTAVLLVCGPDAGTPQEFYSVAGSLGDEVYVTGDSVCWFTKDIIDSSFSATIEVDSMGGVTTTDEKYAILCRFYANIFNADGTFKEQKKLDLMTERRWPK